MKIGILADIHGNSKALESIIRIFRQNKVERTFCLGDMIGYYHNPLEVLELLIKGDIQCILGNHEAYLMDYIQCPPGKRELFFLEETKKMITPKYLSWLRALPKSLEIEIDGKSLAFFHGSPWDPLNEYIYPDSGKFGEFAAFPWDYICLAHTHYPMLRRLSDIRLINPGSCGQPRDGDTKASAVILDLETYKVSFIKEKYDIQSVIREAKLRGVSPEAINALERVKYEEAKKYC